MRRKLSFLVDVSKLKCWQDVKSDMNGVYSQTLRIATWTVEVYEKDQVQILEKKVELASDKEYHMYIHSMKNKAGLCRSIFLLFDRDKEIVNSACLLQYTVTDNDCEEVDFDVPAHRNSKRGKNPSTRPERVLWRRSRVNLLQVRRLLR